MSGSGACRDDLDTWMDDLPNTNEQPSTTQASDDDECAFVHVLPSGNLRCGALRRHHSQYTGHQFTEPRTDRKHCNQSMRYDVISNGDIFDGQRLVGTYYCERCSTMQPIYEPVNNNEPPAPRAGEREHVILNSDLVVRPMPNTLLKTKCLLATDDGWPVAEFYREEEAEGIAHEHNQHATLVAQRERAMTALKRMLSVFAPYANPDTEQWREEVEAYDEAQTVLATIEQEGEGTR